MEDKGFALRLLPFLAAKQTEDLMYGTVFEVGFASGSSYLDNTGITSIGEIDLRPVFISVKVTFKRGKRGGGFGKRRSVAESFVRAFARRSRAWGSGRSPDLKCFCFGCCS